MRFRGVVVLGAALGIALPQAGTAQEDVFRAAFLAANSGRTPTGLALGDLDCDGSVDAVTANSSTGTVTHYPQFDGFLFPSTDVEVGNAPSALAVADIDGDAMLDILVANANDSEIAFVKGLCGGSFAEPIRTACGITRADPVISTCDGPNGLVVEDFNGDGRLDVAVASESISAGAPGFVNILLGAGNGSFTHVKALDAEAGTHGVATGDVNADGRADLVAANSRANTVSVYLGLGNGNFGAPASFPTGPEPQSVALGDLNGDGRDDVVTGDRNGDAASVLLANSNGSLRAAVSYRAGTAPSGVSIADLTGDGRNDVVVSNNLSGDVSVLAGDGQGRLGTARNWVADGQPVAVATGQIFGDEQIDVVTANVVGLDGSVAILRNRGTGVLHAVEDLPAGTGPSVLAVGDVDNDALPDMLVGLDNGTLLVFAAAGGARFAAPREIAFDGRPRAALLQDFNGDGRLDLAVVDGENDRITVRRGLARGNFAAAQQISTAPGPAAITGGDFDGDGKLDLAVTAFGPPERLSVFRGDGNLGFTSCGGAGTQEAPVALAAGDLDRDGRDDIAVVNQGSDTVSVLMSNSDASSCTFIAQGDLHGAGPTSVVIGLFDADANLDIAFGNKFPSIQNPSVWVFFGNGDGSFRTQANRVTGAPVSAMLARDFTGDQCVDLALVDQTSNQLTVARGNCAGRFSSAGAASVSRMPVAVIAGDFDGDGRYDAATANSHPTANNLSVLTSCVGDAGCVSGGAPAVRGEASGDGALSAADLVALAREAVDGDGSSIEDIGRGTFQASRGVDANGDGRVDGQDALAIARRIFAGA